MHLNYGQVFRIVVAVLFWSVLIWRDYTRHKGKPLSRLDRMIRIVGLPIIGAFLLFLLV